MKTSVRLIKVEKSSIAPILCIGYVLNIDEGLTLFGISVPLDVAHTMYVYYEVHYVMYLYIIHHL